MASGYFGSSYFGSSFYGASYWGTGAAPVVLTVGGDLISVQVGVATSMVMRPTVTTVAALVGSVNRVGKSPVEVRTVIKRNVGF